MPDTAQSIADLVLSLLEDWQKFCRFLLLLFVACALLLGLAWGVLRMLPSNTGQVKLGSGSIIFSQPTQDGNEYLAVISPQGWQETGISLRKGDRVSIEAYGKVHIDLSGLNKSLAARRDADDRVIGDEKKTPGKWEAEKDTFSPEDHYTDDERKNIRPTWHWTGPDGIADTPLYALKARMARTVLPGGNYGALLGAIRETGVTPDTPDVFLVGSGTSKTGIAIEAKRGGKLYFTVNDVQSYDKEYPNLFFEDNIGFFYAKVTVSK
jgi:hypothetical protein